MVDHFAAAQKMALEGNAKGIVDLIRRLKLGKPEERAQVDNIGLLVETAVRVAEAKALNNANS